MTANFFTEVETIIGPLLAGKGFTLDGSEDSLDERGGRRQIVYYRSKDCKIQIYQSPRDNEINCMIAPLNAPNEFGPRADYRWQYFTRFVERPNLPLEELIHFAKAEKDSYSNPLEWVPARIDNTYEQALAGIQKMHGNA